MIARTEQRAESEEDALTLDNVRTDPTYVFSESERAMHARHAQVPLRRQFVPTGALGFITSDPMVTTYWA
jgi:hypothetical protein